MKKFITICAFVMLACVTSAFADCSCEKKKKNTDTQTTMTIPAAVPLDKDCGCSKKKKEQTPPETQKVYIHPAQVNVDEAGILVAVDQTVMRTSALFSDQQGLYIRDYGRDDCPDDTWYCSKCGDCHQNWYVFCPLDN